MTDPVFGRALPIHFFMLDLACWHDPDREDMEPEWEFYGWPEIAHEDKIRQIIQARANLFYWTESDFGFSLREWRAFLLKRGLKGEDDFGYGHPYAVGVVDAAIVDVINDPMRGGLEAEAARREAEFPLKPQIWWPGESNTAAKEPRDRRKVYDWREENAKFEAMAGQPDGVTQDTN